VPRAGSAFQGAARSEAISVRENFNAGRRNRWQNLPAAGTSATASTRRVRSVADNLPRDGRAALQQLSCSEQVELALHIGDDDAAMLSMAAGIGISAARRRLAAQRACGRQRSVANVARQC
jgi:hypothetical protein